MSRLIFIDELIDKVWKPSNFRNRVFRIINGTGLIIISLIGFVNIAAFGINNHIKTIPIYFNGHIGTGFIADKQLIVEEDRRVYEIQYFTANGSGEFKWGCEDYKYKYMREYTYTYTKGERCDLVGTTVNIKVDKYDPTIGMIHSDLYLAKVLYISGVFILIWIIAILYITKGLLPKKK